eukprot:6833150-Pyramimonas_sp.AAC.1
MGTHGSGPLGNPWEAPDLAHFRAPLTRITGSCSRRGVPSQIGVGIKTKKKRTHANEKGQSIRMQVPWAPILTQLRAGLAWTHRARMHAE